MTVSQRTKNVVDRIAWIAGAVFGFLASNAVPGVTPEQQALITAAGILGGDVVSDAVAWVDTGTVPVADIAKTWTDVKPIVTAQVAKLSPGEQQAANLAIAVIDEKLATTPAA